MKFYLLNVITNIFLTIFYVSLKLYTEKHSEPYLIYIIYTNPTVEMILHFL
jgi:hypothetical protein